MQTDGRDLREKKREKTGPCTFQTTLKKKQHTCATNSCMLLLVISRVPVSLASASVAAVSTECKTVAFAIAGESGFCVIDAGVRAACC